MSGATVLSGLAAGFLLAASMASGAEDCGTPGTLTSSKGDSRVLVTRVFKDGSIAVRARLAVNPDGGKGAYTVGDHGFTYIANGLSIMRKGVRYRCDLDCRNAFLKAELKGFAEHTPEFCVYAMEVEPFAPGQARTSCGNGRYLIGNGKGRLRKGPLLDTVSGATVQSYVSTTSLRHKVDGQVQPLDSETLPIAVAAKASMLGSIVWVAGKGLHGTFALVGESGPAFGEGSIALHQLLHTNAITAQASGPIPVGQRCSAVESGLTPPFRSSPDKPGDGCRKGRAASSASDIRAYNGISEPVDFVVLGQAGFSRKGGLIEQTVTRQSIDEAAARAGYTQQRIRQMLACLPRS
ncbi:hypothetical protein N0B28_18445 [Pseudomonas sp. SD17-1]|uniref:hypothetical protein n=1 Tax=Pseudomonas sp. SD17-1 TaxID=2976883 RepID=UPI0005C1F53A|nr:hypothetical protein [Pseudomonas sp. SD17-1]KIU48446.1 hypothetical protein QV12_17505 [Pseudomonas putida]WEJ20248.1 hypothetical protein N0B28_18445 [Pseudomonas sp. SD17-1]